MKNKFIKIITYCILIIVSILCFSRVISVKADSGWDSSYDSSSSSWDSGSSYDSSSSSWDSDSNYDSCSSGPFTWIDILVILSPILILFFIYVVVPSIDDLIRSKTRNKRIDLNTTNSSDHPWHYTSYTANDYRPKKYTAMDDNEAKKIISDFNPKLFCKECYDKFYDIQISWMNFDYDKLKELLTDELYNTYLMDLEVLKSKNQRNVMKKFKLVKTMLIDLKEENDKYIAKVILEVKFVDYIENIDTHKVLRGKKFKKLNNIYILTFERTKDINENICPNCGSKVEGNVTGICDYCKSKLINKTYGWIMSNKEKISQR